MISFCEFESRPIEVEIDGQKKIKTTGCRVCPKSSPLFQEFKIWQILNNIQVIQKATNNKRFLEQEEKEILFAELSVKDKLSKDAALKLLFKNHKDLDLNYKEIEGNRTQAALFNAYQTIIELSGAGEYDFSKMDVEHILEIVTKVFNKLNFNTAILQFNSDLECGTLEKQPMYQLWHLLYSFEGDELENMTSKISDLYGFNKESASVLANISFQPDYGSLSTKAIRKILPYLKEGNEYSIACEYAGYRHSKNSLTKEELDKKVLKDRLDILAKIVYAIRL